MGDRSYMSAIIYACPPERQAEVLAVFERHDVGLLYPGDAPVPGLLLGEEYGDEECGLDTADEVAADLNALGIEGLIAKTDQASRYEFTGSVNMIAPGLGWFSGYGESCVAVGWDSVDDVLTKAVAAGEDPRPGLERLFGVPWERALAAARSVLDEERRGMGKVLRLQDEQGWTAETLGRMGLDFIADRGLDADFAGFAQAVADTENDSPSGQPAE